MNKIYVGNLPFTVTEDDLRQTFSVYGEITEIAIIKDKRTERLKGFGFITFVDDESAQKALDFDGKELIGRPLRVSLAKTDEEKKRDNNFRPRRNRFHNNNRFSTNDRDADVDQGEQE